MQTFVHNVDPRIITCHYIIQAYLSVLPTKPVSSVWYLLTHVGGLPDPLPVASEGRDVGHHTQHGLAAPEHGLRLDLAEPDLQLGAEVLPGQLQHRHVAAAVQLGTEWELGRVRDGSWWKWITVTVGTTERGNKSHQSVESVGYNEQFIKLV